MMTKIAKILIAGVAVAVFGVLYGWLTCGWLFRWVYDIEPTNVWQQMEGAPPVHFYVGMLVLSIILAIVYALLVKGIPGGSRVLKGLVFGLCVWAVGMLPGMWATYLFMTVATPAVNIYDIRIYPLGHLRLVDQIGNGTLNHLSIR